MMPLKLQKMSDSDYRPSSGRESEETSTEASVTNPQGYP